MSMCGAGGKPCSCQPQEGMLCPEIVALAARLEGLHRVLQGIASAPYDIEGYPSAKDQAAWMQAEAENALALTPATALRLHEADVLDKWATNRLERMPPPHDRTEYGEGVAAAHEETKREAARLRAGGEG